MNKSIIALALAAAICTPVLAMAETPVGIAAKVYDRYATECLSNARPGHVSDACKRAAGASEVALALTGAGYNIEPDELTVMQKAIEKEAQAFVIIGGK